MTLRKFVCTLLVILAASVAFAQHSNIPQFSADMRMTAPGGQQSTGKIYWGSGKIRFDMNAEGHDVSMIQDVAKKTSYLVMHQQRMYMEAGAANAMGGRMHAPDLKAYDPNNPCAAEPGYTCKKVGAETVNGRSCDKWQFTGPNGDRTVWIDQKLHFPIRTVSSEGGEMDITNVKEGSQPASLFQVPAGYMKMDMGGMMGRRPPQ